VFKIQETAEHLEAGTELPLIKIRLCRNNKRLMTADMQVRISVG
jgi:hypothetical protein